MRFAAFVVLFVAWCLPALCQEHPWVSFDRIGFGMSADLFEVAKDGKHYVYHAKSGVVADATGNSAADMTVVMKDGRYGVIRDDGDLIVPFEYDNVWLENDYSGQWYPDMPYHYKFVRVEKASRYGLVDEEGRMIVPPQYDDIRVVSVHFIAFREGNRWGWINPEDGKVVQPPVYDEIRRSPDPAFAMVVTGDKLGLARRDGTTVIPMEHKGFLRFVYSKEATWVWGNRMEAEPGVTSDVLYDLDGKVRLSGFSGLESLYHADFIRFEKDGRKGAVNPLTDEIVIEPVYERIDDGVRGRFKVSKDGLYGVLDEQGKVIVPVVFSKIDFINVANQTKAPEMRQLASPRHPTQPHDERQAAIRHYREYMDSQSYFIRVERDGGHGLLDWSGTVVASPQDYDAVQLTFHKHPYIIAQQRDSGHHAILDSAGNTMDVFPYGLRSGYEYNDAAIAYDGAIANRFVVFRRPISADSHQAEISLYDLETGKMTVPMARQHVEWISQEYFKVREWDTRKISLYTREGALLFSSNGPDDLSLVGSNHLLLREDRTYRLVNMEGDTCYEHPDWSEGRTFARQLFPRPESGQSGVFHHGMMKLHEQGANVFVNERCQEVGFEDYDAVDDFYMGTAFVAKEVPSDDDYRSYEYRYGMIDVGGNEIYPVEWEAISGFRGNDQWREVVKGGKRGLVDRQGNYVLQPVYDYIESPGDRPYFEVKKDGKVGLVARDGSIVLEPQFERLRKNHEGRDRTWPVIAEKGDGVFVIDEQGHYLPVRAEAFTY